MDGFDAVIGYDEKRHANNLNVSVSNITFISFEQPYFR